MRLNTSLISVIIPVYKVEPYLRQCLDSVVNQTYRNLEIIIIDDGSPDGCGTICDEYAVNDQRVRVIHKTNGGLSAARNDGIRLASGEYLTFVDSDDWLETDYFEKMARILQEDCPDVLCAGGVYLEEKNQTLKGRLFCQKMCWKPQDNHDFLIVKILTGQIGDKKESSERLVRLGAAWDKICRTSFIRERQLLFDEKDRAWEDIWFSLNVVLQANTVMGCEVIGYHYRFVDASITKGYNPNKPRINHAFLDKMETLFGAEPSVDFKDALAAFGLYLFNNGLKCSYLHPACTMTKKQIYQGIAEMKRQPWFDRAIHSRGHRFLTTRQRILKTVLKISGTRQVVLIYKIKRNVKK